MKHTEKMLLGGAAIVALAGLSYWYVTKQKAASTVPAAAALQPGTPVTTLTVGQKYALAALLPTGITDQASLTSALTTAGWTNVAILYFMGNGQLPAGVTAPGGNGYVATGTWNGSSGAAVTPGALVVASS